MEAALGSPPSRPQPGLLHLLPYSPPASHIQLSFLLSCLWLLSQVPGLSLPFWSPSTSARSSPLNFQPDFLPLRLRGLVPLVQASLNLDPPAFTSQVWGCRSVPALCVLVSMYFRSIYRMSVFAFTNVCAAHVCLVPKEASRQQLFSWNWSYRVQWC